MENKNSTKTARFTGEQLGVGLLDVLNFRFRIFFFFFLSTISRQFCMLSIFFLGHEDERREVRLKRHEVKHACVYSGQPDPAVSATSSKVAGGRGLILSKCEMSRGAIWRCGSRICNPTCVDVTRVTSVWKNTIRCRTRSNLSGTLKIEPQVEVRGEWTASRAKSFRGRPYSRGTTLRAREDVGARKQIAPGRKFVSQWEEWSGRSSPKQRHSGKHIARPVSCWSCNISRVARTTRAKLAVRPEENRLTNRSSYLRACINHVDDLSSTVPPLIFILLMKMQLLDAIVTGGDLY